MRKLFRHSLSILVAGGCLAAVPAYADPVTITSGQLTGGLTNGAFTLNGSGLSLSGYFEGLAASAILGCGPCTPSSPTTLSMTALVNGGPATTPSGEFNGVTYAPLTLGFNLMFTSPGFSTTNLSASNLSITEPFTMNGSLQGFASGSAFDNGAPPLFTAQVNGSGMATAHFGGPLQSNGTALFFAKDVTYTFSASNTATPEPASLLLLATGVVPLALRRRRTP